MPAKGTHGMSNEVIADLLLKRSDEKEEKYATNVRSLVGTSLMD
jgi:hypothetical protein